MIVQMAVVIRMARHGAKKKPFYRIVAADENFPRDGRYLEILGTYNPKNPDNKAELKKERIDYWMAQGAKPSQEVSKLIKRSSV